jgi:multidrug resistance efflux pump
MKSSIWLMCLVLAASACQTGATDDRTLKLSGVVEAAQATLVAEIGGRVVAIQADEGEGVNAGDVLVRLDDATLAAQVKQAEAGVSAAEASLAQVRAGARSEAIAAAQAALTQAEAQRDGAMLAIQDATDAVAAPQVLLTQIDAARTGAKLAEQNVAAARSKLGEARWRRDTFSGDPDSKPRETLDKQLAIAQRELDAAQAQLDGANAQVKALEAMRRDPVALKAQVNSARSAYSVTLAGVNVASASLVELKAGAAPEDIALAEARLRQAQAQLKLARAYQSRALVRAPLTGTVSTRSAHVGETIQPGAALMTIMNLDEVTLVVYVPQVKLPRVAIGVPVKLSVDAYPGETFDGSVSYIADRAQFSSRDTQAREDRANVVFAVKMRVPNPDHRLKAGMTADATIELRP